MVFEFVYSQNWLHQSVQAHWRRLIEMVSFTLTSSLDSHTIDSHDVHVYQGWKIVVQHIHYCVGKTQHNLMLLRVLKYLVF